MKLIVQLVVKVIRIERHIVPNKYAIKKEHNYQYVNNALKTKINCLVDTRSILSVILKYFIQKLHLQTTVENKGLFIKQTKDIFNS